MANKTQQSGKFNDEKSHRERPPAGRVVQQANKVDSPEINMTQQTGQFHNETSPSKPQQKVHKKQSTDAEENVASIEDTTYIERDSPFSCTLCNRTFTRKYDRNRHMLNVHNNLMNLTK
ncbi:hypothetical protein Bbelb_290640 [Branchiostoma belcheri]|nr:hypothetical protein Bbelb_290640 [Branchiostoma belcheri]